MRVEKDSLWSLLMPVAATPAVTVRVREVETAFALVEQVHADGTEGRRSWLPLGAFQGFMLLPAAVTT